MKNKTLQFLIMLLMFVCLIEFVICLNLVKHSREDDVPKKNEFANEYFDLVTIYEDFDIGTKIAYDKNTNVMYFIMKTGYKFGITPIYNEDGSLKLYKEGETK